MVSCRKIQRRLSVFVFGVDISLLREEESHNFILPVGCRLMQRREPVRLRVRNQNWIASNQVYDRFQVARLDSFMNVHGLLEVHPCYCITIITYGSMPH